MSGAVTDKPVRKAPSRKPIETVMQPRIDARRLRRVHDNLLAAYGPQGWWPAEEVFEILVGAVLTQNTAWRNVEKALDNLRARNAMEPRALLNLPQEELAEAIRPSGYFNIKADRLHHLCRWYVAQGGFAALAEWPTETLRRELLSVKGVGPETADDILLYAFERPVFVVDAYTFRIFERYGLIDPGYGYEALRAAVEAVAGPATQWFNELHALLVVHGNQTCRPRPLCSQCPLRRGCQYARETT